MEERRLSGKNKRKETILIRLNKEELIEIKKLASNKNMKVAEAIRTAALEEASTKKEIHEEEKISVPAHLLHLEKVMNSLSRLKTQREKTNAKQYLFSSALSILQVLGSEQKYKTKKIKEIFTDIHKQHSRAAYGKYLKKSITRRRDHKAEESLLGLKAPTSGA